MLVLGLTGSAAMGKSTVTGMFREKGVPVFDADRAVHDLYAGEAASLVEAEFQGTTVNGVVDRKRLRARVLGDDASMKRLEAIVHPLVLAREEAFRTSALARGERLVLLDIPLLFETGGATRVDVVAVVSAPAAVQRERLASRGLAAAEIDALLARQMPDAEKRRRAHFIIDTGGRFEATRQEVEDVIHAVAGVAGAG